MENTAQHNPGPWRAVSNANDFQGLICSDHPDSGGKNIAVSYETKDADLIAAAPELLEALEKLIAAHRELLEAQHINHYPNPEAKEDAICSALVELGIAELVAAEAIKKARPDND